MTKLICNKCKKERDVSKANEEAINKKHPDFAKYQKEYLCRTCRKVN